MEKVSKSILLVDDDLEINLMMCEILEFYYTEVHSVRNGKEALDALKSKKYDVLITDIKMPIMNGIELINEVVEMKMLVEIIVLTSYVNLNKEKLKNKISTVLSKPVNVQDLIKSIT